MAIFRYTATDTTGKELHGAMDAPTEQDVVRRLSERGYRGVQIAGSAVGAGATVAAAQQASRVQAVPLQRSSAVPRPIARPSAAGADFAVPQVSKGFAFGTASPQDIGLFFRQMASLVHSGFTVSSALQDLGMRTRQGGLARAAKEMGAATAGGSSMAPLMVNYPGLFAPHMVGLVAAGETGGFVEFAFEEIALGAEQDASLKQGMWWPKILIWNAVWTVLLMIPLFVGIDVHKLSNSATTAQVFSVLAGYNRPLAWIIPLGIGLHIGSWLIGKMRHQPFARDFFDRISLGIPVMAKLARMRALASFTRVLRRLLMSGISPAPAYSGAVQAVPNAALRERLGWGTPIVRGGQGIDQAIQATGLMQFDPLQMLVTGQKTGQWLEMLDRVTAFYQDEAAHATDAAKSTQKRLAGIITLIITGFVVIVGCKFGYDLVFAIGEEFSKG